MGKLYFREKYLKKLRGFYDDVDMIKVITGVRRCGKTSLMEMVCDEIIKKGVDQKRIIYIHLDKRPYKSVKTTEKLEEIIDSKAAGIDGIKYHEFENWLIQIIRCYKTSFFTKYSLPKK